ncbi:MAG: enolase C-terminal domain-like protein [Bacteroidota bacterium]|nr:enolase C-terminal domain-like protein [Bacteroidota bacterium]MDP4255032.1 enolase C-terminal domain-like protein [Bacteroidota bacterium]MDP4256588.1 enolase C-terminal domain-like protein [Bacteroidota bacterium]
MRNRRKFLSDIAKASAFAFLPFPARQLLFETAYGNDTIIDSVEILQITGPFTTQPGINHQFQVQPIHIYPELRPTPYKDDPSLKPMTSDITQAYIRIRTKGGIEGLYGMLEPETVTPILQQLRPFLLGKDAMAVSALWDELYRNNRHSRAGHYMMALSAVDNVLWDIRGKYFKTPVYELLGGATRKNVGAYGSCLSYSVEKGTIAPRAKELFNQGFIQQKWFMAYGPGDGNAGLRKNIEAVEEVRDALGQDAQIMFDAYQGWDLPFATAWCRAVDKYNPYWIEEAFAVNRLESFLQLRRNTTIPLATGEHFYSRWEVLDFLQAGAIEIVQADPEWCGGVSELVKICSLASAYGAKVYPHGHNIHAALHVIASQSPDVCPLAEYLINHMPYKLHFQKYPLQTANGILALPTKPGFGIELDESRISKRQELTS